MRPNTKLPGTGDPRIRLVPMDARYLYGELAGICVHLKSSALRFPGFVPNAEALARFVGVADDDVARCIQALCSIGLVTTAADGAYTIPALVEAFSRSEINRANGLRGGRPKSVKGQK
jgi:hypothetical protein